MNNPTCTQPGCDKLARSKSAELCPMHYHRVYRHGRLDITARDSDVTASPGRRYRMTYRPGHPVAGKYGNAYVHRVVLFDSIGVGPHACHWCGTEVRWATKGEPNTLHVDHLNGLGDDNRPENLVPSCGRCNSTRGLQARGAALRAAGWWANNDTVARTGNGRVPLIT